MTRSATETPRISVIIPTFNRASMVCDCVASVLATGYPELEVIVVDDCSPDDTGERIASRFGNDARVRYMRNGRNSFQAASRNRGAAAATGDHLLFLDDDNIVHPDILQELEAVFAAHPEMGRPYGHTQAQGRGINLVARKRLQPLDVPSARPQPQPPACRLRFRSKCA